MVVTRRSARLASSEEETPKSKSPASPKLSKSPEKLKNSTPVAANGKATKLKEDDSKEKMHPMTMVVFISLLLDLLAFTMILPLLPALMELYRNNDSSGLFQWLLTKVAYFQHTLGVPDRYNSVLFGGIILNISFSELDYLYYFYVPFVSPRIFGFLVFIFAIRCFSNHGCFFGQIWTETCYPNLIGNFSVLFVLQRKFLVTYH
jgi:hypothetical protein